jgi:hypothetical protein
MSPSPTLDPSQRQTPSPSPSESPSGDQAESAPSPTASSGPAADGFFADAGPAFDPERAPDAELLVDELAADEILPEGWEIETVRSLLVTQGQITHLVLRVGDAGDETTWRHTEDDLRAIAPPLTRMLNRYDATRAAAAAGDEISLVAGLTTYATRNYIARRRLLAQAAGQRVDVPVSGRAAEPDTGPPPDDQEPEPVELREPPPALRPKGVHAR